MLLANLRCLDLLLQLGVFFPIVSPRFSSWFQASILLHDSSVLGLPLLLRLYLQQWPLLTSYSAKSQLLSFLLQTFKSSTTWESYTWLSLAAGIVIQTWPPLNTFCMHWLQGNISQKISLKKASGPYRVIKRLSYFSLEFTTQDSIICIALKFLISQDLKVISVILECTITLLVQWSKVIA